MEMEYLSVDASSRMRNAARVGTTVKAIRCRQVNRGSASSGVAAGVVLTRLFQHIDSVFRWNGSDLEVLIDPALHLQATVVGGIEADAISVLILTRPANRGFHLYISTVQDRQ